jgi:putative ABC transport system permease protein
VSALPGVAGAGVSHVMPLDFGGSRTSVDVSGYKPEPNEEMELNFTRVTPGYFAAMRMPILQGRSFDERDGEGQPERIIVNETMARRYWPEGRAVGGLLRTDSRQPFAMEVIGVVPDVHYRMVREVPVPSFYVPMAQLPSNNGVLHVRFAGGGAQSAAVSRLDELRRVVSAVNPAVPIARAHTLVDQVERNIADERMATAIGVTLAVVALLLAAAGLYATMAFIVGRRTREMGVRMALGARAGEVRSLVLREGVVLTAIGVAGGTALAAVAGRTIESLLYGVGRTDVVSLAAAAGMLTAAAVLACWIPARRASRVDPIVALRED